MENEIVIRRMSLEDLSQVINLGLSTQELKTGTKAPQFYSRETLRNWIQSPNGILLTALYKNNFIGFSITSYNPDSRDGYIHCIAINEDYRGKTMGSNLTKETINELKKTECNHIYCLVKVNNKETKRFFSKHGFETGEAFNYVQRTI